MSSEQWEHATALARTMGLEYEDFTFRGWEKLIDFAQEHQDGEKGQAGFLAGQYRDARFEIRTREPNVERYGFSHDLYMNDELIGTMRVTVEMERHAH